jgi:putative oxidoreductase
MAIDRTFIATWTPRAQALLRLVTSYLFLHHATAKFFGFLSGEMAFAYFLGHASHGQVLTPMLNQGELAVLYCFIFLFLAAAGPGAWSVDGARS